MKKNKLLFSMLFVGMNVIGSLFSLDRIGQSVDVAKFKEEYAKVCKDYEAIEKARNEEMCGLRALYGDKDDKPSYNNLYFFPNEKMKKTTTYKDYYLPLEAKFLYVAYRKQALNRIIRSAESPLQHELSSDLNEMRSGLQLGLYSDPYSVNLDRNHLRAIRAKVKNELNGMIVSEWSKTTANRVENIMDEYR